MWSAAFWILGLFAHELTVALDIYMKLVQDQLCQPSTTGV